MSEEKKNVYQIVTDKIIELLDNGVVPWRQPWRSVGFIPPISINNRRYRGINVFILAFQQMTAGYKSPIWMTYKQAQEKGGKVKTGEKATLVVFWKVLKFEDKNDMNEKVEKKVPLLRYFYVFNIEQTEGVKLPKKLQAIHDAATVDVYEGGVREEDSLEAAQQIVDGYEGAPTITYRGGKAFYLPKEDTITIPAKKDFEHLEGFYATIYHEFGHSTGHESRLNRKGVADFDHFGSGKYAEEELVAELTAAYLCGDAGINNTVENSAAYIASWKQRLQADPKLIVGVAAKAQKAADLILGRTFETEGKETE